MTTPTLQQKLLSIQHTLSHQVNLFQADSPVLYTYNPLEYAAETAADYLLRYGATVDERVLLLGMNPGPWGMAQTGVPFGDVHFVRDWMKIEGTIEKPTSEHPKRSVDGFLCTRSEVSGSRLWGWAEARYSSPENFFSKYFVWNYCPLSFMLEMGANFTPNKLSKSQQEELFQPCSEALRALVETLNFSHLIGVGTFAEKQLKQIFKEEIKNKTLCVARILHPSPASPAANRGWAEQAEQELELAGALK